MFNFMFMKCFKKKLATGLVVASVVLGGSSAFANEARADDNLPSGYNKEMVNNRQTIYDSKTAKIVRIVMKNGEVCYVNDVFAGGYGGTATSISCFEKTAK